MVSLAESRLLACLEIMLLDSYDCYVLVTIHTSVPVLLTRWHEYRQEQDA